MEDTERKNRFEKYRVEFMDQVKPTELICHMDDCLTQQLKEQVERWEDRHGPNQAAYRFSMDLVKKDEWYSTLLRALRKLKHDSLADKIEGIDRKSGVNGGGNRGSGNDGGGNGGGNSPAPGGNPPGGNMPSSRGTKSAYNPHQAKKTDDVRRSSSESSSYQRPSKSQEELLNTRIGSLPSGVRLILERLNIPDNVRHKDWRGLAMEIDEITLDEQQRIEHTRDPIQELLNSWKQGDTLGNLLKHLYKLGRHDMITDFEKQLGFHWPWPETQDGAQEASDPANNPARSKEEKPTESTTQLQQDVSALPGISNSKEQTVVGNINPHEQAAPDTDVSKVQKIVPKHEQKTPTDVSKVQKIVPKHEQQNDPQRDGEYGKNSAINDVNHRVVSSSSNPLSHVNIIDEAESGIDNNAGQSCSASTGSFKSGGTLKDNESGAESGTPSCQDSSDVKTSNSKIESTKSSAVQSNVNTKSDPSVSSEVNEHIEPVDEQKGNGLYCTLQSNAEIPVYHGNVPQEHPMSRPYKSEMSSVGNENQSANIGETNNTKKSDNEQEHIVKQQKLNTTPLCSPAEENKKMVSPSPELKQHVENDPQHELPERNLACEAAQAPILDDSATKNENNTMELFNQELENNKEAAVHNLAKCADFDFDKGASPCQVEKYDVKTSIEMSMPHDDTQSVNHERDPVLQQVGSHHATVSSEDNPRGANAMNTGNDVQQATSPVMQTADTSATDEGKSSLTDDERKEANASLLAKIPFPSLVQAFANVSTNAANGTCW